MYLYVNSCIYTAVRAAFVVTDVANFGTLICHTHGEKERETGREIASYICSTSIYVLAVSVVILSLSRAANLVFPAGNCSFQSYKDKKPQKTKTRQSKKCEREGKRERLGEPQKILLIWGKKQQANCYLCYCISNVSSTSRK